MSNPVYNQSCNDLNSHAGFTMFQKIQRKSSYFQFQEHTTITPYTTYAKVYYCEEFKENRNPLSHSINQIPKSITLPNLQKNVPSIPPPTT